jgi:hypothetical protein
MSSPNSSCSFRGSAEGGSHENLRHSLEEIADLLRPVDLLLLDPPLRRHPALNPLPPRAILAKIQGIVDEPEGAALYYLGILRRCFHDEGPMRWCQPLHETQPSVGPALELTFAVDPPIPPVRTAAAG